MKDFIKYANKVVKHIPAKSSLKLKIKEDIINQLEDIKHQKGINDPIKAMGEPEVLAKEFIDNMDIKTTNPGYWGEYEYKSKIKIYGIPLVHINMKRNSISKGIFSIGAISFGVFSFGGISFGLFSFGAISFGFLFALGAISVSLGVSIGALSIGYLLAFGGMAISKVLSFGGLAIAKDIAIGDVAMAKVCGYKTSYDGMIGINIKNDTEQLLTTIKENFPNLQGFYYSIIEWISKLYS
jgi:hypothetical protein